MDLRDANVLVVGGARRLGREITIGLANTGVKKLVFTYHDTGLEEAQRLYDNIRLIYSDQALLFAQCSIDSDESVDNLYTFIEKQGFLPNVVVNCASFMSYLAWPDIDLDLFDKTIESSVRGTINIINAFAPLMVERGEGRFINLTDISATRPWRGSVAHAAGKAAMEAMTRAMAVELAPSVLLNNLALGMILPPDDKSKEWELKRAQKNLLKKWGGSGEVVKAVHFIVESNFMTGSTLTIDGGELLC